MQEEYINRELSEVFPIFKKEEMLDAVLSSLARDDVEAIRILASSSGHDNLETVARIARFQESRPSRRARRKRAKRSRRQNRGR